MVFLINDTIWRVQYVNANSSELRRSDGTCTFGVTDNNNKTVTIMKNMSDYMTNKVLCHELVHVFCFENNYNIDIQTEEIIADFMSLYGRDIIYLADDILSKLCEVKAI